MNEYLMIVIMAYCGIMFAVGGTCWKPARRYGIPLFLAIIAYYSHVSWWQCLGMAISLIVALSSGYGSGSAYIKKALVFLSYGLSFLWLGWSLWVVLMPVMCLSIFALSNWKYTTSDFFWKGCEFMYGVLIGITFISMFV